MRLNGNKLTLAFLISIERIVTREEIRCIISISKSSIASNIGLITIFQKLGNDICFEIIRCPINKTRTSSYWNSNSFSTVFNKISALTSSWSTSKRKITESLLTKNSSTSSFKSINISTKKNIRLKSNSNYCMILKHPTVLRSWFLVNQLSWNRFNR